MSKNIKIIPNFLIKFFFGSYKNIILKDKSKDNLLKIY